MKEQRHVELQPMTSEDYALYLEEAIREYAAEKVRAGNWKAENALEEARKSYAELLPQGTLTPKNFLYSLLDATSKRKIGMIWYQQGAHLKSDTTAFIYDFSVLASERGKGYGRAGMQAVEQDMRDRGIHTVQLHVFGHNTTAIELYKSAGYVVTNLHMKKRLA